MPKNFHCSGCGGQHKRPVGVKCQFKDNVDSDLEASGVNIDTNTDTVNHDILHALNSVSSRLTAIEQRIQNTEDQLQKGATSFSDAVASPSSTGGSCRSRQVDSEEEDDVVTPTTAFLKTSRGIQNAVDKHLQELATLNEQGTYRSQRGGHEHLTVKHKIPWPQNHILPGASTSRVTYDSLSTFHWVSGFCAIIKDEGDVNTKNSMLEYLSELMEDAQDFGWTSAKRGPCCPLQNGGGQVELGHDR